MPSSLRGPLQHLHFDSGPPRKEEEEEEGVIKNKGYLCGLLTVLLLLRAVLPAPSGSGDEGGFDPPHSPEAYQDATAHQGQIAVAFSYKSEALLLIYGPLMACQYMDPPSSL